MVSRQCGSYFCQQIISITISNIDTIEIEYFFLQNMSISCHHESTWIELCNKRRLRFWDLLVWMTWMNGHMMKMIYSKIIYSSLITIIHLYFYNTYLWPYTSCTFHISSLPHHHHVWLFGIGRPIYYWRSKSAFFLAYLTNGNM